MYNFVNQKTINGKTYTVYRDDKNPKKQIIRVKGGNKKDKECRIKDVWAKPVLIVDLFNK